MFKPKWSSSAKTPAAPIATDSTGELQPRVYYNRALWRLAPVQLTAKPPRRVPCYLSSDVHLNTGQCLFLDGREVDCTRTFAHLGVTNNSIFNIVNIRDRRVKLAIRLPADYQQKKQPRVDQVVMTINASYPVSAIKALIEDQLKIPAAQQRLHCNGRYLCNYHPIRECRLRFTSDECGNEEQYAELELNVTPPGNVQVFVQCPKGETIALDVNPTTATVHGMKSVLERVLLIPHTEQELWTTSLDKFSEQQLLNHRTLANYNLVYNDLRLRMVHPQHNYPISITVKTQAGEKHELNVMQQDSVLEVMRKMAWLIGKPTAEQRVLFAGRQLQEDEMLTTKGITNGSWLFLDLRDVCPCGCKKYTPFKTR